MVCTKGFLVDYLGIHINFLISILVDAIENPTKPATTGSAAYQ